jgi:hypothetical protein
MLKHLRLAHTHTDPEMISTSSWIAQRILIVVTAVVLGAPFFLLYGQ